MSPQALFISQPPVVAIFGVVVLVAVLVASLFLLVLFTRPKVSQWHDTMRVCHTKRCLEYARRLRNTLNTSLNPCESFTRFVCDGWRRRNRLSVREEAFLGVVRKLSSLLLSVPVPSRGQTSLQRAAAFYRSCDDVLQGRADELRKVKRALLDAGIMWPRLPKDSNRSDLLSTWFHASIRLHWSPLLHVMLQQDQNVTTVALEPLSDFERILLKHKGLEGSDREAKVYFEELRREFLANREHDNGKKDNTTVTFTNTKQLVETQLNPLGDAFESTQLFDRGLDTAFMFRMVPGLTKQRWLQEVDYYLGNSERDVAFVSEKPRFVRAFMGLWRLHGEDQMHLFFSWCIVQTAALFANQKLLLNFHTSKMRAELYHGALCLSKVYLLSGREVFGAYYDEVLSGSAKRSAQLLVVDTRKVFAARLEHWRLWDPLRIVVQDWNSSDVVLGYFDPRFDQRSLKPKQDEPTFPDMNTSLVDNWQAVNLDHVDANDLAVSVRIEFADWFTLLPGRDLALLPYAFSFPSLDESATPAMNHGGLGYRVASALSRLFTDSYIISPEAGFSIGRSLQCAANRSGERGNLYPVLRQLEHALALEVSLQAYRQRSAASEGYDELLEGFEGYSSAALFFIAACYSTCLGSERAFPEAGDDECDDIFRNVQGFSDAIGCAPGSPMNPFVKCGILT
ncbi:uncharacterized protein LOC144109703 [Amblyomma americanum]